MLNLSKFFLNFQRGGWGPATRHQKHMGLNPTAFLYRIPRKNGPGPYVMKYWWTLGCFPTGLDVPFRLKEFLHEYQSKHVPIEVEEWLQSFVKDPVEEILTALDGILSEFEMMLPPFTASSSHLYQPELPMVTNAIPYINSLAKSLGVFIPAICVRAVAADKMLKNQLVNELYEYGKNIQLTGSTPHRRAMVDIISQNNNLFNENLCSFYLESGVTNNEYNAQLNNSKDCDNKNLHGSSYDFKNILTNDSKNNNKDEDDNNKISITQDAIKTVGGVMSVNPNRSAEDEISLVKILTTFGEGGMKLRRFTEAEKVQEAALFFAYDNNTRSTVHANIATANLCCGHYDEAEYNAKEAVLLNKNKNGFKCLSIALAYLDRFNEAISICDDGLEEYPSDIHLLHTKQQIVNYAVNKPQASIFSSNFENKLNGIRCVNATRINSKEKQIYALENGSGYSFNNEYDSVKYNGKNIDFRLNPTTAGLGSVFRRAHVPSIIKTSTNMTEPL